MAAATITVTVLVVLLIVAVVALLMKINKDSKRMDALGSESLVKRMANPPIERPAVMRPAVMPPPSSMIRLDVMPPPSSMIRPAVMPRRPRRDPRDRRMDGSYAGEPSTSELAAAKVMAAMRKAKAKAAAEAAAKAAAAKETPPNAAKEPQAPVDDIENIGDQSLMLAKIAIPQPDENWLKSRQVQPVKDLSVGIAITNDVSKQDNLQTGKITSKFPISIRPAVMPPMFPHKGPQGKPAYFEAMRAAAAKAAQERDAKARSMVDKRARSMAENSEMQALKRIDNSGMKQYDMKKGPPQAMFGIDMGMKKTMKAEAEQAEMMAMKAEAEQVEMMAMKAEAEQARFGIDMGMGSAEEAANKAAMKVEGYEMMEPRGYAIRV
jgi:hypothetical protein